MKKKNLFFTLATAGVFALFSCNNEDEVNKAIDDNENGVSEITLALNPSGSGLTTRTARPVYASEAANNVNEVALILYKTTDGGTTWTEDAGNVDETIEWTYGPADAGIPGTAEHSGQTTIKVKNLEASSNYKLVARGYNNATTAYTFTDANSVWTAASTGVVEEIFAGELAFSTGADKKITTANPTLTMDRHVAGILGFFKNIPVTINGEKVQYIKVYASASASAFTLPSSSLQNQTSTTAGTVEVLSIDMQTEASDFDAPAGETYAVNAKTVADNGYVTDANSVLAGKFLIPFAQQSGTPTLKIALVGTNGTDQLKTWTVYTADNNNMYDINRNQFYSIGKKLASGTNNGGGGDPDTPIDLSVDNTITLIINDAWNTIYDLGVVED